MKFGGGGVLKYEPSGSGSDHRVTVRFDDGSERTLLSRFLQRS
jgi:hypothetical protein